MQNEIERLKQKTKNTYSHLLDWEKRASTYGEDSSAFKNLRWQVESILDALNRTNGAVLNLSTVKESSNLYHQQKLSWEIIDKLISAQENYVYAMESVEKGYCSQKDALDLIAAQQDRILEAGKSYLQLEEITPVKQQERADLICATATSVTATFGKVNLDSSQTEPSSPLKPVDNSRQACLSKQEVDERRKRKSNSVSERDRKSVV